MTYRQARIALKFRDFGSLLIVLDTKHNDLQESEPCQKRDKVVNLIDGHGRISTSKLSLWSARSRFQDLDYPPNAVITFELLSYITPAGAATYLS